MYSVTSSYFCTSWWQNTHCYSTTCTEWAILNLNCYFLRQNQFCSVKKSNSEVQCCCTFLLYCVAWLLCCVSAYSVTLPPRQEGPVSGMQAVDTVFVIWLWSVPNSVPQKIERVHAPSSMKSASVMSWQSNPSSYAKLDVSLGVCEDFSVVMLRRVIWYMYVDVSDEFATHIVRVGGWVYTRSLIVLIRVDCGNAIAVNVESLSLHCPPWRRRRLVPPTELHYTSVKVHGVT